MESEMIVTIIIMLVVSGVCTYGYINNIFKILTTMNGNLPGLLILRVIGIFFVPLGVLLGFF